MTWSQFYVLDFPYVDNVADVHIKMTAMIRRIYETSPQYYYKMYAIGEKDKGNRRLYFKEENVQ